MPQESMEGITKSDKSFAPTFVDPHLLLDMNFIGHCLIKSNISIPKEVINLYISYTLGPQLTHINANFTLGNCLFGSVKLTDLDRYMYMSCNTGFDSRSEFSFEDGSIGKCVITFGAGMSSSVHVDNKKKDIFVLDEGPTQGLDDTKLTAEPKYPFNFTQSGKRFVLNVYYNGSNSFLFVNATKIYQFKAKISEIKDYALCLGNLSKDFTINNMKKTGLKRVVIFFSVYYNPIDSNDILDIHKYLIKPTLYQIMFGLIKKIFIVLLTDLVNGSNQAKRVSLSNQKFLIHPTLINLRLNEYCQVFHYCPFSIELNRLIMWCKL